MFAHFFIRTNKLYASENHLQINTLISFPAYEKGHQRPPLTVYTFQAPDQSISQPASPVATTTPTDSQKMPPPRSPAPSIKSLQNKPPLPTVSCHEIYICLLMSFF